MKDKALALARAGFRVFPLRTRDKRPLPNFPWKDLASNDKTTVASWWDRNPNANIGLATGGRFLVVDVDKPEAWGDLLTAKKYELPPCPTVRTGKGMHLYFAMPAGFEIGNRAGLGGGVFDVRGNGGYVVAPPSVHPDGQRYEWATDVDLAHIPLPPDWLLDLLTARKDTLSAPVPTSVRLDKYVAAALAGVSADVASAPEGQRNATLYTKGRRLFLSLSEDECTECQKPIAPANQASDKHPPQCRQLSYMPRFGLLILSAYAFPAELPAPSTSTLSRCRRRSSPARAGSAGAVRRAAA